MRVPRTVRTASIAVLAIAVVSCVDTPAITSANELLPSLIERIFLEPASLSIVAGGDAPLDVHLKDADGRDIENHPVVWVSSDSSVAIVSDSGVVTALKPGTASIIAIAGKHSAQAVVEVSSKTAQRKPAVTISPAAAEVLVEATAQLSAEVVDTTGKAVSAPEVSWSSASPAIATVTQAGVVTGVAAGTAQVSVSFKGVSASAKVTVKVAPPPPPAQTAASGVGSLYTNYSVISPHWSHIRTLATDFYYHWTPTERAWAGKHFDYALSGGGDAWRSANPTVGHLPYTLLWTVLTPSSSSRSSITSIYYDDMQKWYASHPEYRLEDAFLHSSSEKSKGSRLHVKIWDSERWMINPADAGARAYTVDRYRRIASDEEGVFIDEASSGDILPRVKGGVELSSSEYQTAYTSLLAEIKQVFGSKMIMLNTAEYTKEFDRANAAAAGAVHLELFNNPMYSGMPLRWEWVEDLLSLGVSVDMVGPLPARWANEHSSKYPKGNYATSGGRLQMWELASYYMVVGQSPDGLFFHIKTPGWDTPFSQLWFKAQEANIGHPTGARSELDKGRDPVGQSYTIYQRDFDRALVLVRTQRGWNEQSYRNETAVTVPLPSGETWLPLHADGTLGAAVESVKLRNSEALILVKKSKI